MKKTLIKIALAIAIILGFFGFILVVVLYSFYAFCAIVLLLLMMVAWNLAGTFLED